MGFASRPWSQCAGCGQYEYNDRLLSNNCACQKCNRKVKLFTRRHQDGEGSNVGVAKGGKVSPIDRVAEALAARRSAANKKGGDPTYVHAKDAGVSSRGGKSRNRPKPPRRR
mgnify:CR=1 FL=1